MFITFAISKSKYSEKNPYFKDNNIHLSISHNFFIDTFTDCVIELDDITSEPLRLCFYDSFTPKMYNDIMTANDNNHIYDYSILNYKKHLLMFEKKIRELCIKAKKMSDNDEVNNLNYVERKIKHILFIIQFYEDQIREGIEYNEDYDRNPSSHEDKYLSWVQNQALLYIKEYEERLEKERKEREKREEQERIEKERLLELELRKRIQREKRMGVTEEQRQRAVDEGVSVDIIVERDRGIKRELQRRIKQSQKRGISLEELDKVLQQEKEEKERIEREEKGSLNRLCKYFDDLKNDPNARSNHTVSRIYKSGLRFSEAQFNEPYETYNIDIDDVVASLHYDAGYYHDTYNIIGSILDNYGD